MRPIAPWGGARISNRHARPICEQEAHMNRLAFRLSISLTAFFIVASVAEAQMGKTVSVNAGTPEDKALTEIYAAPDGPEKIALLDKFSADFGKGDLELLADQLYASTYLAQKNYAKTYEYAGKALTLDPENLSTAVTLVHAAEEQGDIAKIFDAAERANGIVTRFKSSAPPAGMSKENWEMQKQGILRGAQDDISYFQNATFNAAYKLTDSKARAGYMERFAKDFPDSPYAVNAREQVAFSEEQAQNFPKMMEAAQAVLAADPKNVDMLVLLSDFWSEKGQQLDKAADYAQKAIDILSKAQKPEGADDGQWQQQIAVQKGLAYSALGEVYVNQTFNVQAVNAFRQATPLLKSNPTSYARNQYRLGFTLAKMQKIPEARAALTEAASIDSPYRALAQQTLAKLSGGATHTAKKTQ
jgi:tetratricopeptide (TPR) repeat protein